MTDEAKRARNRAYARKSRARRRMRRHIALAESDLTGPDVRKESITTLFEEHVRRVHTYLRIVELDPNIAVVEKIRIYISALVPLARSGESLELNDRLSALEARFSTPLTVVR